MTIKELQDQFAEQGYLSPERVLTVRACKEFLRATSKEQQPPPEWHKGYAASSRAFYEIATHNGILDRVEMLIGEDIMLWGASVQSRAHEVVHPWHSDIESWTASMGQMVSVWIGLENTAKESSLKVISYSHRFGVTVQQLRHDLNIGRNELSDDEIVRWAKEYDQRSELLTRRMSDGEALFLDGRLWHGSRNMLGKTRRALLLQYATPDTPIRIPDLDHLDWPFRQLDEPRPPCVMVRGKDKAGANRIVASPEPPHDCATKKLTSRVYPLQTPLSVDHETGWKPHFIFNGSTANAGHVTCHASSLKRGKWPHPPHWHQEEEILIVLSGEVEVYLPSLSTCEKEQRRRLQQGELVYYPVNFAHTLQAVSEIPANYLMFKWHSGCIKSDHASELAFGRFHLAESSDCHVQEGFCPTLVFEGPTAYLQKLHCHLSTLSPGAGYDPHIDKHDVAMLVLAGEVETLGQRVTPYSVIFCGAGEPHGIHNPSNSVASYLVFEFHRRKDVTQHASDAPRPVLFLFRLMNLAYRASVRLLFRSF